MPVTRRSPRGAAKRPAETEAEPEKAQRPRVEEANVPAAAAAAPSTSAPDVPAPESAPAAPAEVQAPADAPSAPSEPASAPAPAAAPSGAAGAGAGAGGGTAMIRGLPKTWDERDFRKWLDTLVVARSSCKKKKQWPYGFITFGFLEDRLHATKTLEGCVLGGRRVTVHEALNKKPHDKTTGSSNAVHGRTREELIVAAADRGARRDVRDAVCPLWATPYNEQLAKKRAKVEEALRNLTRHTAKNCKRLKKQGAGGTWRWPSWIGESNKRGKLAAPVEGIVRSPVLEGYRNKSEFTIGPDAD
jgi:tRNA (uracil-5-)-methyltransferase